MTTTYHNLGCTHKAIGDLEQAKSAMNRHSTFVSKESPPQVDVATIYNKPGDFRHDMGGLQQAQDCYDKALHILSLVSFHLFAFVSH